MGCVCVLSREMGCDFEFTNITRGEECDMNKSSIEYKKYWYLFRNIDRGAKSHIKHVFLGVMEFMRWSIDDEIIAECCCGKYRWKQDVLTSEHDLDWKYEEDICGWVDCPVCNSLKTDLRSH